MKMRKERVFDIFKSAQESDLLTIWVKNHPKRYSGDASGLKSWRSDVRDVLHIEDDSTLSKILSGDFKSDLINSLDNWADFRSIFSVGSEIKDIWDERSGNRSFGDFKSFANNLGLSDISDIIAEIKKLKVAETTSSSGSTISGSMPEAGPSSDIEFYKAILNGIGAPVTNNNLLYLYAWRQSEGGSAAFNPFNTTRKAEGATNYSKIGVKNYTSAEQGVAATVNTLLNDGRYATIINCLRADRAPMETAEALVASPWGTSSLIKKVISGYEAGYSPKPKEINQSTERIA